jgi:hypothetical protein
MTLALCLAIAGLTTTLPAMQDFTLTWRHSVEKVAWEEDWRLTAEGLQVVTSRIKGSGAGMEPPEDSRLVAGWYEYHPTVPALPAVHLARSGVVADWVLCIRGTCEPLGHWMDHPVPDTADATLTPCPAP